MDKEKKKKILYVVGAIGLAAGAFGVYMLIKKAISNSNQKKFIMPVKSSGELIQSDQSKYQQSPDKRLTTSIVAQSLLR